MSQEVYRLCARTEDHSNHFVGLFSLGCGVRHLAPSLSVTCWDCWCCRQCCVRRKGSSGLWIVVVLRGVSLGRFSDMSIALQLLELPDGWASDPAGSQVWPHPPPGRVNHDPPLCHILLAHAAEMLAYFMSSWARLSYAPNATAPREAPLTRSRHPRSFSSRVCMDCNRYLLSSELLECLA